MLPLDNIDQVKHTVQALFPWSSGNDNGHVQSPDSGLPESTVSARSQAIRYGSEERSVRVQKPPACRHGIVVEGPELARGCIDHVLQIFVVLRIDRAETSQLPSNW